MSTQVQLLVYDLSRGMASQMSQIILGERIDGIWHTGVQVFGQEYYFGGGIQASPIGYFALSNNLPPVQTLTLGTTTKTKPELEAFLRSINHQFNAGTYDLLRNNCNNFSDAVAMFLLGTHIPTHIVDLPNIVFNTPGGAALRPMIEQMQQGVYAHHGRLDPFGGNGPPANNTTARPGTSSSTSHTFSTEGPGRTSSVTVSSTSTTTTSSTTTARSSSSSGNGAPTRASLEEKALVSNDGGRTVEILGNKLLALKAEPDAAAAGSSSSNDGIGGSGSGSGDTAGEGSALTDDEKGTVRQLIATLGTPGGGGDAPPASAVPLLSRLLDTYPTAEMGCLFLLRLVVLHPACFAPPAAAADTAQLVVSLLARLVDGATRPLKSPAAMVMAVCVLSNVLAHEVGRTFTLGDARGVPGVPGVAETLLDVLLKHLSHPRTELRQISATAMYNVVLAFSEQPDVAGAALPHQRSLMDGAELSTLAVQVFLGCFEDLLAEREAPVRHRRLATALRVVRAAGAPAISLGKDLGFDAVVVSAAAAATGEGERDILAELRTAFSV